jgi:hypothetical protein
MATFKISGLAPEPFMPLYGLADAQLTERGIKRYVADGKPGFPDRIELRDVEPGEPVLLLNFEHQPAHTPYRSSHAIFVREGASQRYEAADDIPESLRVRPLSLRAFDINHMLVDADLAASSEVEPLIAKFLGRRDVAYIHAHFAKRGCYAALIERAPSGDASEHAAPSARPRPPLRE